MIHFDTLAFVERLEQAGINRRHAEALADELHHVTTHLVTHEQLKAELDRHFIRQSAALAAIAVLTVTLCKIFG